MTKLSKESFTIKLGYFCDNKYPMSRSEARRIVKSLSVFKEVTLDFEEINNIYNVHACQDTKSEIFR